MEKATWLDRIEKIARVLLWLSIASACVIIPIAYITAKNAERRAETKAETDLQEAVKRAESRAEELERKSKSRRLGFATMSGTYLSSLAYSAAQGNLWFTNISPRAGVVCLIASAQESDGGKSSESLPACQEATPYATVHMTFMFAGGDLTAGCPKSSCHLTFKEAPEAKEDKSP